MEERAVSRELCEERHANLTVWSKKTEIDIEKTNKRIKTLENRFLIIMTTLSLTLLGVIINLIISLK